MFINYRLADGSVVLVEATEEVASFILENDREIASADRRERYHAPYHLDALDYEDNIDGNISDDRFARMSETYEAEQKQLEARVAELESAIAAAKEERLNVDSFLGMVRKYTDITELTAEIIRSFVEKIEVKKPEKVPGTRTKKQTLIIWWNFIGVVDIPEKPEEQRETA